MGDWYDDLKRYMPQAKLAPKAWEKCERWVAQLKPESDPR